MISPCCSSDIITGLAGWVEAKAYEHPIRPSICVERHVETDIAEGYIRVDNYSLTELNRA
jgi:hypothetical protein